MNQKYNKKIAYITIPFLALSFFLASSASAHGFEGFGRKNMSEQEIADNHTQMFADQAQLLGVSVDEVKDAWANGKSFVDLASEKGMTKEQIKQKMADQHKQKMKDQVQALVTKGVITQDQANKRIANLDQIKQGKGKHKGLFGFKK